MGLPGGAFAQRWPVAGLANFTAFRDGAPTVYPRRLSIAFLAQMAISTIGSTAASSCVRWAWLGSRSAVDRFVIGHKVDPLERPLCGGQMKIISFIERRQHEVIERILRHYGLWEGPIRTLASRRAPPRRVDAAKDRQLVLDEEFLECQRLEHRLENQPVETCELPLVLDPKYL
jgi:hypothetical protein